jgi:CHAT domain-containing protein
VQAKRKATAEGVLALAQSQAEGFAPLRFAEIEAESIARLYHGLPLVGGATTERAFRDQAPAHAILHLAAHGELNERSPLFSRVFLGPDAAHDGSLTVQEV